MLCSHTSVLIAALTFPDLEPPLSTYSRAERLQADNDWLHNITKQQPVNHPFRTTILPSQPSSNKVAWSFGAENSAESCRLLIGNTQPIKRPKKIWDPFAYRANSPDLKCSVITLGVCVHACAGSHRQTPERRLPGPAVDTEFLGEAITGSRILRRRPRGREVGTRRVGWIELVHSRVQEIFQSKVHTWKSYTIIP